MSFCTLNHSRLYTAETIACTLTLSYLPSLLFFVTYSLLFTLSYLLFLTYSFLPALSYLHFLTYSFLPALSYLLFLTYTFLLIFSLLFLILSFLLTLFYLFSLINSSILTHNFSGSVDVLILFLCVDLFIHSYITMFCIRVLYNVYLLQLVRICFSSIVYLFVLSVSVISCLPLSIIIYLCNVFICNFLYLHFSRSTWFFLYTSLFICLDKDDIYLCVVPASFCIWSLSTVTYILFGQYLWSFYFSSSWASSSSSVTK